MTTQMTVSPAPGRLQVGATVTRRAAGDYDLPDPEKSFLELSKLQLQVEVQIELEVSIRLPFGF